MPPLPSNAPQCLLQLSTAKLALATRTLCLLHLRAICPAQGRTSESDTTDERPPPAGHSDAGTEPDEVAAWDFSDAEEREDQERIAS